MQVRAPSQQSECDFPVCSSDSVVTEAEADRGPRTYDGNIVRDVSMSPAMSRKLHSPIMDSAPSPPCHGAVAPPLACRVT